MRLIYFDETKFSENNPFFFIGGVLLPEEHITALENTLMQIQYNFFLTNKLDNTTELHGQYIFNGIGTYRKRKLEDRIKLFQDVGDFLIQNKIPIRLVCVDVKKHKKQYDRPEPEYHLGLMLILERFCHYLDKVDDIGIVFGDYEKDEISKSILDFSQFKQSGKTPMYHGRPLGRLKDTIYFTHSHHSRFLQVADMVVYMANRYENSYQPKKWHDKELFKIWNKIKENTDFFIKRWPVKRIIGERWGE
ncbi:MAG: DUF3800 domain-containing protein [Oligoflexia bacterium]|nr:DUF3800 domain-containing protein [Oligoflexia bacterium]